MLSSVTCRIDTSHPSELWQCIERKSGGGLVGHEVFIPFLGLCLPPLLHLSNCLQFSIHGTRVSWKCEKGWGLSLFFQSSSSPTHTHTNRHPWLPHTHPPHSPTPATSYPTPPTCSCWIIDVAITLKGECAQDGFFCRPSREEGHLSDICLHFYAWPQHMHRLCFSPAATV